MGWKTKIQVLWYKGAYKALSSYRILVFHLHNLYKNSGVPTLVFFLKFLFHRYGTEQFDVSHVKENYNTLCTLPPGAWVNCDRRGRLIGVTSVRAFRVKNALLFGALQNRVERAIYYSLLTLCLEVHNPFNRKVLKDYIVRKKSLLNRMAKKCRRVNERPWSDYLLALRNIDLFERNSLIQEKVIKNMERIVANAPSPPIVGNVQQALKKGLYPQLVIQGLSGTYWMKGCDRQIAGLFKPYDEEAFAPNNPCGPTMQGALGKRRMRPGIRVGECAHREVAAFVVDQFFGFGMVPRTYYATFSHSVFYSAGQLHGHGIAPPIRIKIGSFQEYIAGFVTLGDLPREQWMELPEIEVQLLILLDVILGNCDRHAGNILIGEEKLAAIDHGLCFSSINFQLSTWYWKALEQGNKPLPPTMVALLHDFPFEKLAYKLWKECFINIESTDRLRERVMLFREGILRGKTPRDLADLFSSDNMRLLWGLKESLGDKVKEIVDAYCNRL